MKNNLDTPVAKQCRALYTKYAYGHTYGLLKVGYYDKPSPPTNPHPTTNPHPRQTPTPKNPRIFQNCDMLNVKHPPISFLSQMLK